ncbi:hypothetical protein C8R43DRAFT_1119035 [Mycena crocata]|nr:hypothetical protein C8R43DRAFT_1119035 [Mycena crocata]
MSVDLRIAPPALPVELEREIFEMAARSRVQTIPTLMLVASRVKIWVEPLLYRTLFVSNDRAARQIPALPWETFQSIARQKPAILLRCSVRHIFLDIPDGVPSQDVIWLFTACSHIENMCITGSPSSQLRQHLSGHVPLPLKRLYCDLHDFFLSSSQMNFTHPLFSHLTHLFHFGRPPPESEILALIPHISHLAFYNIFFIPLFLDLLNTCKSLLVLVYLDEASDGLPDVNPRRAEHPRYARLVEALRFVAMKYSNGRQDWQMGAHRGVDFWSQAEDFVARRKSVQVSGEPFPLTFR